MKNFLTLYILLATLTACSTYTDRDYKLAPRPNVIFVMADDIAWSDMGYNGATFYETPNIDQLAQEGMILNRFYPGGSNCAPTRAILMTGMYTPRHHLYQPGGVSKGNIKFMRFQVPHTSIKDGSFDTFESNDDTIDAEWVSVAEVLQNVGYTTARLGKWHIGDDEQGFDLSSNNGIQRFSERKSNHYGDIDVAEQLTDRAIEFISDNRNRPFFLYLAHWEAHGPLKARRSLVEKYKKKKQGFPDKSFAWKPAFAAEVEVVDHSVGRLREKVKELGLDQNTVFIFTSDNGGAANNTRNLPLRNAKGSLFEGGIRTPFVIAWPDHIPAGAVSNISVTGVDLMPTLAELTGAELPTTQPVDGVSAVSVLTGNDTTPIEERAIFWHYPLYLAGTTYDRTLPVYGSRKKYWRAVPSSAIVKGDWKLIHFYEYNTSELYNLVEDLGEKTNLADAYPEVTRKLETELFEWVKMTDAPVPRIPNPLYSVGQ